MIIYKTTNLINGKIYVGQDSHNNPNYLGSGVYICKSIKKYGKENFKKEILWECNSKEELNEKEIYWIKTLNSKSPNGYNLANGGYDHGNWVPSEETLKRMSDSHKGKKQSKENIEKRVKANTGKKRTEETKKKIKESKLGEKNPMFGKTQTVEHIQKKIKSRDGYVHSKETKEKMKKPRSEESKLRMKISQNNPEVKEKIRIKKLLKKQRKELLSA